MNLCTLPNLFPILLIILVLLLLGFMHYRDNIIDSFENNVSDTDLSEANNHYASLLLFLQQNPTKSIKFIEDIKKKFFNETCSVRDNIDFSTIAQFDNGMIFS